MLILVVMFSTGVATNVYSDGTLQKYGILGQTAPEFKAVEWVDKEGNKIDPVQISDYKGKVIYILFFQDW